MTGHEMTADHFDCVKRNIKKVKFQEVILFKEKEKNKKKFVKKFKLTDDL